MRYSLLLFIILTMLACSTYDSAIVYHKDFHSGTHPLLSFTGYYGDTIRTSMVNGAAEKQVRPIFFYANGSVFATDNYIAENKLITAAKLYGSGMTRMVDGSWGNYLVQGDTIVMEKFQKIENNYVRIIMKGDISKGQIHWFTRKFHREDYETVNYSVFFQKFDEKPDSTQNFTRTLPVYNK